MTKKEARKEAEKRIKENVDNLALRSCWKCNGAHEHLKEADYVINCFGCGHWYYKGIDLTE